MLFQRHIEPSCAYCCYGTDLGCDTVACVKRGIMAVYGSCGSFRYEPTKRIPEAAPVFKAVGLSEEDFML